MGRVIVGPTFDLRLLAKPGYCGRVSLEETSFEQVRRAARRDVYVLEVDDTDEWARYALGQILERLGTDRVFEVKDHFMEIGDTLFVCAKPDGSRWFRVTLLTDLEMYAKIVPNLESEVTAVVDLLRDTGSQVAFMAESLRARGEHTMARHCRMVARLTTETVIGESISRGYDEPSRKRVILRLALDRLENK